jgi:FtsZ-interacting cell division protein ZipA
MDKSTTAASYTASITTTGAGLLTLNNIAIVVGIVFTVATFVVNWHSQRQRLIMEKERRAEEAELHRAKMNELTAAFNEQPPP